MKKKKKNINNFGKGFAAPFIEPNYFKNVSHKDVFDKVNEHLNNHFYRLTNRIKPSPKKTINPDSMSMEEFCEYRTKQELDKIPHEKLTDALIFYAHSDPSLFENDNPLARKLVAHFGNLVNQLYYSPQKSKRDEAKDVINKILTRPKDMKGSQKNIPIFLSLNDMFGYLHKITEYLKQQYIELIGHEPINSKNAEELSQLKEIDERLFEIAQQGELNILLKQPHELTKTLMADFFGLKKATLKQYLKEEKKHPNYYTPQPTSATQTPPRKSRVKS